MNQDEFAQIENAYYAHQEAAQQLAEILAPAAKPRASSMWRYRPARPVPFGPKQREQAIEDLRANLGCAP